MICRVSHFPGRRSSNGCAWSEGWATFLQGAIQGVRFYQDTEDVAINQDIENAPTHWNGPDDEGAVFASLWDIFDPANEEWDSCAAGINGDSSNGIWGIVFNKNPNDIFEFANAWSANARGFYCEVSTILSHHQVMSSEMLSREEEARCQQHKQTEALRQEKVAQREAAEVEDRARGLLRDRALPQQVGRMLENPAQRRSLQLGALRADIRQQPPRIPALFSVLNRLQLLFML